MKRKVFAFLLLLSLSLGAAPVHLLPRFTVQAQAAKTRIVDTIVDASGRPRRGKVTFILTQKVSPPAGIIQKGATVSAQLDSAGRFDISVYPSSTLQPTAYYQVWFSDSNTGGTESLGVYSVPATANFITLTPYRVIDTNLAAQYTFASVTDANSLISAVAGRTTNRPDEVIGQDGKARVYKSASGTFEDSSAGNQTVSGGDAGQTGQTGATERVANAGSTTIGADTDNDGVGVVSVQVKNQERIRVADDGVTIGSTGYVATTPFLGEPIRGPFFINNISSTTVPGGGRFATGTHAVMRAELLSTTGGMWGSSGKTNFASSWVTNVGKSVGSHLGYFAYLKGLGIGDTVPFNAVNECWGGQATQGTAYPGCAALGEFDAITGNKIFRATTSTNPASGATTIHYKATANEDYLGQRYLLNKNRMYSTGTVTAASGSTISFRGTSWTSVSPSPVGQYIKIGSTDDLYTPPCVGNDVQIDSLCVGHWYKVTAVLSDTQLQIEGQYDVVGLTTTFPSAYLLMQGGEVQSFDTTAHTLRLPANRYDWAQNDVIYSPPHHIVGMNGVNLIFTKRFKTLAGTVASYGIKTVNNGPQMMDYGYLISGQTGTGLGGFRTGIRMVDMGTNSYAGVDMSSANFSYAAMSMAQGAKLRWGATGAEQIFGGGDGIRLIGATGGRSLFASDNVNSSFVIEHPSRSVVKFYNSSNTNWLTETAGKVSINVGVSSAGGLKVQQVSTGSIGAGARSDVTLTWSAAFADTNYVPTCTVVDTSAAGAGLRLERIRSVTTTAIVVQVINDSDRSLTGTLNCNAIRF